VEHALEGGNAAGQESSIPGLGRHVAALDGLRGVAILLVLMYHFGWGAPAGLPARLWVFSTTFGWSGVDLFFVLSGFLITGILLDSKDGPHYFRNFYARRVLRIFPLYYGVLVVTLVVLPLFVSYDTPGLRMILHEQGWLWAYSSNVAVALRHGERLWNSEWLSLGVLWSLAVEEHFYLVWPLVVYALPRRSLLRLSTTLVVLAPFARFVARVARVAPATVYMLTPFRADALALGAILAIAVRQPDLGRALAGRAPWAALGSAFVLVLLAARRRMFDHDDLGFQSVGLTAAEVLYGWLLLEAVTGSSPVRRVLSSPKLTFFGKYSYGAYMLHLLLRPAYVWLFPVPAIQRIVRSEVLAFIAHAAIAGTITFLLAVACFHVYERPFLGLKRFFDYRRVRASEETGTEVLPTPRLSKP
jgi:peptidoglycan/LPS O-acetylase OafA/YrhL